jgi:hypothetical protein
MIQIRSLSATWVDRLSVLASDGNTIWSCEFIVNDVTRVSRFRGLEDEDFSLATGNRSMFDTTWYHEQLTVAQCNQLISEFDIHRSPPDQKHLVLVGMRMPGKRSAKLHEFYFLAIQRCDNFGTPMLMNQRELREQ